MWFSIGVGWSILWKYFTSHQFSLLVYHQLSIVLIYLPLKCVLESRREDVQSISQYLGYVRSERNLEIQSPTVDKWNQNRKKRNVRHTRRQRTYRGGTVFVIAWFPLHSNTGDASQIDAVPVCITIHANKPNLKIEVRRFCNRYFLRENFFF